MTKEVYTVTVYPQKTEWRNEDGQLHRATGPAIECTNGHKVWYWKGLIHREDGPALQYEDGTKEWFLGDLRHRTDGPAIEYSNGDRMWYSGGLIHREDGPAIELTKGDRLWYQNGDLHREDGPAIIKADGTEEWWVKGVVMTEEEFTNGRSGTDGLTESDISKILSGVDEDSRKATRFHLEMVSKTTGEILMRDVEYCLELSDRMRKYAQKTGAKHWTPERGL